MLESIVWPEIRRLLSLNIEHIKREKGIDQVIVLEGNLCSLTLLRHTEFEYTTYYIYHIYSLNQFYRYDHYFIFSTLFSCRND